MDSPRHPWLQYGLFLIAGFLIGMLVLCNPDDALPADNTETKVDVRYRYVTTVDTFVDRKPILKYRETIIYVPSSESMQTIPDFKPSDYQYTYERSFWTDGNRIRNDIRATGWGKIDKIESKFTVHDTLADSVITNTTTKHRARNALFAGFRYQQDQSGKYSLKQAEIDYTIGNKVILGIGTGLNEDNKFIFGGKIGFKIH